MMKIKNLLFIAALLPMFGLASCSSDEPMRDDGDGGVSSDASGDVSGDGDTADAPEAFRLCKGADVSWLTEMEARGVKFYYDDGREGDCIDILKNKHVNAIRLRVWVDPASKYCGTDDVIAKAKRAVAAGMDVMIDFHYSDTWADPGSQTVPKAWQGQNADQLCVTLAEYTKDVLGKLKDAGVTPKWVQVGNETGNGMLWPYGKADENPKGYADMISAGYDAVKAVCPDAKVIVHIQSGENQSLFQWNLDILKRYNARYDIVGMSLYPEPTNYAQMVQQCKSTMLYVINRYDKDVMLCEVGMGNSYVTQCKDFLSLCFRLSEEIDNNRYLGLLYWEPQCYNDWNGYRKGCFTSKGAPSEAMDAYSYSSTSVPMIPM